jgi:hypothetical protein
MSKKSQLLDELVNHCIQRDGPGLESYVFDNDLVKLLSNSIGFRNQFETTRIDTKKESSPRMLEEGLNVVHLGATYTGGKRDIARHAFVRRELFHDFEKIEKISTVMYHPGPLDELNTSESNILSLVYNHGIIHRVLYPYDLKANPSIYMSHRTRFQSNHRVGDINLPMGELQVEVDMTIEFNGHVTVFEGKNHSKARNNFAIYQLYMPFRYYHLKSKNNGLGIKEIDCCYVMRKRIRGKNIFDSDIDVYRYTFENPDELTSIRFISSERFQLRSVLPPVSTLESYQ